MFTYGESSVRLNMIAGSRVSVNLSTDSDKVALLLCTFSVCDTHALIYMHVFVFVGSHQGNTPYEHLDGIQREI